MIKYLVLVALFIGAAIAQSQDVFAADVRIYDDPNIAGILTGRMFYDYPGKRQRVNYNIGPQEIIDFDRKLRYLFCSGTCDAETFNEPQPIFFRQTGDSANGNNFQQGSRQCTGYSKSNPPSNGVRTVWVDASNLPCRAEFVSGKKIEFSNLAPATPASVFTEYTTWNCPAQQCNRMIDFVLVFDESGSIDRTSFQQEKNFGASIANSYTFSPYHVAMGLIFFDDNARLIVGLTVVKQSFLNALNGANQGGQTTCIGCGVDLGRQQFAANGRPGVSKIMIVLTDGRNNVNTGSFNSMVTRAKGDGIVIFAIGVAQALQSEINFLASSIPGVQTSFYTADFSQLSGILNALVISTCIDIPGNPCGAGCRGFCSCGATCICPDTCNDSNACTTDQCVPGQGGNGCSYTPISCSDNNACTDDTCDAQSGCIHTTRDCNGLNPCLNYSCIPSVGCQTVTRTCSDGNPCTQDICNPNNPQGCEFPPLPPPGCGPCVNASTGSPIICPQVNCEITSCDPADGRCKGTPISCNDNNLCSTDSCDRATGRCTYAQLNCDDGDACTHDYCDPQRGCVHTPFNISVDCNDNNACTNDTCNPSVGCQHPNVTCNDGNACTDDACNSIVGCQFPLKDCGKDEKIKALIGDCYVALCANERNGCYLEQIPGTKVDECQVCNGDGSTCRVDLSTGEVIGISAGLLAVIIIASIIVCAAVGIFGGKKGYDIWLNHKNNMQGANTNPLYKDDGMTGTNPLYAS